MNELLLRRRMAASKPYDAEIEYLQANGRSYIDTLLFGDGNLDFDIKFSVNQVPTSGGKGSIFGAREEYNRRAYQLTTYKSIRGNGGHFDFGSLGTNNNYLAMTANNILNIKKVGRVITRANGTTFTISAQTFTTPITIALFGLHGIRDSISEFGSQCDMRIYSVTFSKNNVALFDAIPVRKGNIGYMYDQVSGQLFGNAGTDLFILGTDK